MTVPQENKRRADRLYHDVLVAYRSEGASMISGCALDFSSVGLFINSATPLPVGTELKLIISIPTLGTGGPIEVRGRVVRIVEPVMAHGAKLSNDALPPGMGVEFLDVSQGKREVIESTVKALKSALPGINEVSSVPQKV